MVYFLGYQIMYDCSHIWEKKNEAFEGGLLIFLGFCTGNYEIDKLALLEAKVEKIDNKNYIRFIVLSRFS